MDLTLQPKPKIKIKSADKGIVSKKQFFVKKVPEVISKYPSPVLLVREWKPKAKLIYSHYSDEDHVKYQCDVNRQYQNPFFEDDAEEIFLTTPPPCFVIFGKQSSKLYKLSSELCKKYGSVLINSKDVISDIIREENNEIGKFLDRILRTGNALPLNFILALMSYKAHTPKARHRGYVLTGLPSLADSHDLTVEDQINYLFTWDLKPTVFIHLFLEDEEVVINRGMMCYEFLDSGKDANIGIREKIRNIKMSDEKEDDADEFLGPDRPSSQWFYLSKDEETSVWGELELYYSNIRPVIDLFRCRIDPQYFITLDGRIGNESELVFARLDLLKIWKSPEAEPFLLLERKESKHVTIELEEKEEHELEKEKEDNMRNVIEDPAESAFLKLLNRKIISPKFLWELSHYNYICPVTLRSGEVVKGKSEFAVGFMKYIYFLKDKNCMMKFMDNPRAYVLPVRPKPTRRIIILGYPFSGKTSLANSLAYEYSLPILDFHKILKTDRERKKETYRQFCKQKAMTREISRLTCESWKEWRKDEEKRTTLIEEWVEYIQNLLKQRIDQIYSLKIPADDTCLGEETQIRSHLPDNKEIRAETDEEDENDSNKISDDKELEVRGAAISFDDSPSIYSGEFVPSDSRSTASARIIQAFKHEDFNFNENGLEVEANLFFSALWSNLSQDHPKSLEETEFDKRDNNDVRINWSNLLPPQSLSSFLLVKENIIVRDRKKSFRALLAAASKVSWSPSPLKTEFLKWRLPCFMDIPLCEKYYDNPLLLLRYCPFWLKERPKVPEPMDEGRQEILEAGRKAFDSAEVVKITQSNQEEALLLIHAMAKAEKDGMASWGNVASPGGWIVDNMTTNLDIWKILYENKSIGDFVYILTDPEPGCPRLLKRWWDLIAAEDNLESKSLDNEDIKSKMNDDNEDIKSVEVNEGSKIFKDLRSYRSLAGSDVSRNQIDSESSVMRVILHGVELAAMGERDLDDIYENIINDIEDRFYIASIVKEGCSQSVLQMTIQAWQEMREDGNGSEKLSNHHVSHDFMSEYYPVGPLLTNFSNILLKFLSDENKDSVYKDFRREKPCEKLIDFYFSILTTIKELENLKDWFFTISKESILREIDITNRTSREISDEIIKELNIPFFKKPRELEDFEKALLEKQFTEDNVEDVEEENKNEEDEEELKTLEDERKKPKKEDIRIYGESGPFCIVNLEKNILLKGKPEFVLKYYGRLYFFWDQKSKEEFIENPEKFSPFYSAIRCLPSLKIFVIGPMGSGKTSISLPIAKNLGLKHVKFLNCANYKLLPHLDFGLRPFTALTDKKLFISDNHNEEAKSALRQFFNLPYTQQKFLLENPPFFPEGDAEQNAILQNLQRLQDPVVEKSYHELNFQNIERSSVYSESKISSSYSSFQNAEYALKNYIKNGEPLPDYIFDRLNNMFWADEPYVHCGFVMDGFPFRSADVEYLKERNWLPDLLIEITLPEDLVLARNIEKKMKLWEEKYDEELSEQQHLEDTIMSIRNIFIRHRKMSLIHEKRLNYYRILKEESEEEGEESEKKGNLKSNNDVDKTESEKKRFPELTFSSNLFEIKEFSDSSRELFPKISEEMESLILAETEEILKQEFPEMVFNVTFESYEEGKERFEANILENYSKDSAEIENIKMVLESFGVKILPVDNQESSDKIIMEMFRSLDPLKKRVRQQCEFSFEIDIETAEKLLEKGYYFLSKFGKYCPVQVFNMKNPIQMFRPFKSIGKIFPVVYRNYIYFVGGENEKNKFIRDPIKYAFNEPHHPNIPLRIAVIGPPKSGKSTLSQRLGVTFGVKVITIGSSIRFVLENMPKSRLAKRIDEYLRRGAFLPLSLKVEAVVASLADEKSITQGFVFDGLPNDPATAESLSENKIFPFVIFSLKGDSLVGKKFREKLNLDKLRIPYKQKTDLDAKYAEWEEIYKKFKQWNQDSYTNLYETQADLNQAEIFYWAYEILAKSFFSILYYVENSPYDKALPLKYLCIDKQEYEDRKSVYHHNCPGCWVGCGKLNGISEPPPRDGLIQYGNHIYWACPKHFEEFVKKPKKFLPEEISPLLSKLPKKLEKENLQSNRKLFSVHGNGRCPVTRIDFPNSLDWEGSWDWAVSYCEQIFLMRNEEMQKRFLSQPWRYFNADTIFETDSMKSDAVEKLGPPKVSSLPPTGFLEQTVSDLIQESLSVCGKIRPIYPNLSPSVTGSVFIALYLRFHSKTNKTPMIEKQYLDFMYVHCKAAKYNVDLLEKPEQLEVGQGDFEPDHPPGSDESEEESESLKLQKSSQQTVETLMSQETSMDSFKVDIDLQQEKNIWSAKFVDPKITKMWLTPDLELQEIPEVPKHKVHLKYQSYGLRACPIPPIPCINFVYSVRTSLKLPEKFDYRMLYQPSPLFTSPFPQDIIFNPNKEFPQKLYKEAESADQSVFHMYEGTKTCASLSTIEESERRVDPEVLFMLKSFLPRFQLLDLLPVPIESIMPQIVDEKYIIFNPLRDYTYLLLYSQFFDLVHIKKCYESNEIYNLFEYRSLVNQNARLREVESCNLRQPKITTSDKSLNPMNSYHLIFDATCTFFVKESISMDDNVMEIIESSFDSNKEDGGDFEFFGEYYNTVIDYSSRSSSSSGSRTSDSDSKPSLLFQEILPYPPLGWIMKCKPYYSYTAAISIFETFQFDEIAHERHISLLDGVAEPYEEFRFVHYPIFPGVEEKSDLESKATTTLKAAPAYLPVFEFFDLDWTCFLPFPFFWAYNCDLKDNFTGNIPITDIPAK